MKRPDPVGRDQAPGARESVARSKDDDSADRRGIEPRGTKVSASDDVISPFAGSTPGARAKPAAVSRSHSNAI
jgi:hypothetical protein